MDEQQVAELPWRRFRYLLAGLSDGSRFRQWAAEQGQRVDDPAQAARLLRDV